MRVVFMGTPFFAAQILKALIASNHEVVGCFTRPDAVRGRGKKLVASPVKEVAAEAGVPVFEFASMKSEEAFEALRSLEADVACVAAYGAILPKRVLDAPKHGCINVHGSLLPRWRGAAPIERAILAGDAETGVGIMRMEEGLDTGAVCAERRVAIGHKSAHELTAELAQAGGRALVEQLDKLASEGSLLWAPQSEEGATYAVKVEKGELDISPVLSAEEAERRVRAASESHPSRCVIAGKPLALQGVALAPQFQEAPLLQGQVRFQAKRLYLGMNDAQQVIEVTAVKPDGKKPMDAKAFAAGIQGIKQGGIDWQETNG